MGLQDLLRKSALPTPPKYRKIGKSIALLGTMLQVAFASLQAGEVTQLSPKTYIFCVIGIAVLQWAGQTITDFATDEDAIDKIQNGQV